MSGAKTTTIIVQKEEWKVPRGFGRLYLDLAKEILDPRGTDIATIQGRLGLVGYYASPGTVAGWPLRRLVEACAYAINVHLRAADHPIPRHPKPAWLPMPWDGDDDEAGDPGPTVLS